MTNAMLVNLRPTAYSLRPATRACSWESSQPPKLVDGVRLLALVLGQAGDRRLEAGVKRDAMLVILRPTAYSLQHTAYSLLAPMVSRNALEPPKLQALTSNPGRDTLSQFRQ